MAASDASPFPIKNQAYRVTFPIFDNDGDLVTGAAALDSEVSIDGGTFADCTSEATEIATASGIYYLDLTAAEMNGDTIAVIVKTTTTDAKTTPLVLYPVTLTEVMLGVNVEQWNAGDIATVEAKIDTIDTVVDAVKAKTDNLPADPASETNVDANEAKIDIIDTVVDAIKLSTDNLPADPASETNVDANEAKIDIVDTVVDAIKLKTDNLPADPASETNVDANEAKIDIVDTVVDAIKLKTDNLPADPASETNVDANEAKIDIIDTNVDAIKAKTDDLTFTEANKVDSNILAISGSTEAADNLEASAETIVVAAAVAGALSATQMTTDLTEITDDHYNGRIIIWTSGVLQDQATDITDYDGATKKLTFTAVTEAPSIGDDFIII